MFKTFVLNQQFHFVLQKYLCSCEKAAETEDEDLSKVRFGLIAA